MINPKSKFLSGCEPMNQRASYLFLKYNGETTIRQIFPFYKGEIEKKEAVMDPSKSEKQQGKFHQVLHLKNNLWFSILSSRPTPVAPLVDSGPDWIVYVVWGEEHQIEETLDVALFNNQLCDFEHHIQHLSIWFPHL